LPPRVSPTLVTPLMTKCSQCGPAASNRWTLTFKPILHVYIVRPPCTALFAELKPHLNRAGFNTLSRALFRKKCGALQLWRQTLFFLKKPATFFSHHRPCVTLRSLGDRPFFRHAKISAPFVGASFCGGPWSAEHAEHA